MSPRPAPDTRRRPRDGRVQMPTTSHAPRTPPRRHLAAVRLEMNQRYCRYGEPRLPDPSSVLRHRPTPTTVVLAIETARRRHRCERRIEFDLAEDGVVVSRRTVTRHLHPLGLYPPRPHRSFGGAEPQPIPIVAVRCGHILHVDVKKVGAITPTAAAGACTTGLGTGQEGSRTLAHTRYRPGTSLISTITTLPRSTITADCSVTGSSPPTPRLRGVAGLGALAWEWLVDRERTGSSGATLIWFRPRLGSQWSRVINRTGPSAAKTAALTGSTSRRLPARR